MNEVVGDSFGGIVVGCNETATGVNELGNCCGRRNRLATGFLIAKIDLQIAWKLLQQPNEIANRHALHKSAYEGRTRAEESEFRIAKHSGAARASRGILGSGAEGS